MIRFISNIVVVLIFLGSLSAGELDRNWIFFIDKKTDSVPQLESYESQILSAKAIKRRELRLGAVHFDESDKPVSGKYIRQLENLGVRIHHRSRWLNAVSCYLNGADVRELEKLKFVKNIRSVKTYIRTRVSPDPLTEFYKTGNPDYGPSFNQNEIMGIPTAHAFGFHGEDILIAVFDTGFILDHEAFQDIEIKATWDFINDNENVGNEPGDLSKQHNHGTEVLGVLAGYQPGKIIGPAYASQFILAKTEDLKSETHTEEDNWIAAAEWAESLGADIISSSVGYILDYSYEDMDGNTTLITKAADLAVKKGVAVFNSAGNEAYETWKYVTAPADGDSVIAMGGVRPDKTFWPNTSRGPTADGRIKPDLLAQAQGVYTINPATLDGYQLVSGNSFSCPLGAGAGAVLLSAMPHLSPMALRDLLIQYASHYDEPDNLHGYGLIDLESIMLNVAMKPGVSVSGFRVMPGLGKNTINWIAEREINNDLWIINRKNLSGTFRSIAAIQGRDVGIHPESYAFMDYEVKGNEIFTYQISAKLKSGTEVFVDSVRVESIGPTGISLLKNSPNPFNNETRIVFGLDQAQKISLRIYNVNGQRIKTLINDQFHEARYHHLSWNATNDQDQPVSSGTYYLQLLSENSFSVIKLLHMK